MNIENRELSQKLVDTIEFLKQSISKISVYDLNYYSMSELYYNIAKKINELIEAYHEFGVSISEEVIKQNECLQYLLNDGLIKEVVNKINQMVTDGTMDTIINHNIFNDLNSQIKEMVNYKMDYVNVEKYGAKGDGTTDDTNAIKEALESGNNISFKNGKTYLVNDLIEVTLNNQIIDGCGATLKFANGVSTTEISDTAMITLKGNNYQFKNFTIDVNGQWIVRPFTWETSSYDNYISLRKKHYIALRFINCNNLKVSNLILKNGLNGIVAKNTTNFTIEKITINKMMADGIFITDGCSFGNVRDCYGEQCNDDVYACDGYSTNPSLQPHNVTFDNCNSHNCVGALVCLEGSYNTKFMNSTGTEIKHKPFKTGLMQPYSSTPILAYGSYQTIENCKFSLADIVQGDSNGTSESICCGVQSGDNIILKDIQIIKPIATKQFEIMLQGTNYLLDNVKITNTGLVFKKMKNVIIKNCDFKLNDSLFIIEGKNFNITDSYIHNQSSFTTNSRGTNPIIFSGVLNSLVKRCNLSGDGTFTNRIQLIGNAPTWTGFKTDDQSVSCSGGFEGLEIEGVYLAGNVADARFGDGQLVNDQYGFGIIKNKQRIKLALLSDIVTN